MKAADGMTQIINIFLIGMFLFNPAKFFAGGIFIIEETRRNKTIQSKTYIEKHLLRIESNIDGEMYISIYNSEKEILYNINTQRKVYTAITKTDLEKIGSRIKEAKKLFEEKMKSLSSEQQDLMKRMKEKTDAFQDIQNDRVYLRVKPGEKIGNWVCDKYRVTENENLLREVWIADWNNAGLELNYKNVLLSLEKFFNYFTEQLGDKVKSQSLNLDFSLADKGIPVKTIHYAGGEINGTSIIKEIKEEELPYSLFIVPSGFTKENPFDSQKNFGY